MLITLTDKGRQLFERVVPAHLDNEARLPAALLRKLLVEFEGSTPPDDTRPHPGLLLEPAHVTMQMRESVGLPQIAGLLVRNVDLGSPAQKAGITAGDVLIRAAGRDLRSSSSLHAAVRDTGERLTVTLLRGNDELRVRIALGDSDDLTAPGPHTGTHSV